MNEDSKQMLESVPDYIALKRFSYSLAKLEERYPDGCPDRLVAAALDISLTEMQERYQTIISTFREKMRVQ